MWKKIKEFFSDSETIFWARLQAAVGIVAVIVTYVDPGYLAPFLPPEWFPWLVLANGVLTEYLRRQRDPELRRDKRG